MTSLSSTINSTSTITSIIGNSTYENLINRLNEFIRSNCPDITIDKLTSGEDDDHLKIYNYLLFDFSEVVLEMVRKYIDPKYLDTDLFVFSKNKYTQKDRILCDIELRQLVFKISVQEFKFVTQKDDEYDFTELFMDTPDLIFFTIRFITRIAKHHNISSFCGSFDSNRTTNSSLTTTTFSS